MFLASSWGYLSGGMSLTWPNVLASDILVDNSTLFGTQLSLSDSQLDMVGSMMFVGSLPGYVAAGWLVRAIGRRRSMMLAAVPGLAGSLSIALALNTEMILVGRFLEGTSYGMMGVAVRPYIVEVADTDIRGSAVVVANILLQIGSISAVSLGIPFKWYQVSFFSCAVHAMYGILLVPLLPESPTFLAVTNKDEKAKGVLHRLRGTSVDVEGVLSDLKKQNESVGNAASWRVLVRPAVLRQELILFGLFLVSNFSGVEVIKANTSRILQSAGVSLDMEVSTIMVAGVLFCGNFSMMLLLDRAGRRRCLMLSLSLLVVGYCILGAFVFLSTRPTDSLAAPELTVAVEANASVAYYTGAVSTQRTTWDWVPLASLMLAAYGQALGSGPIPWILSSEYFPTSIRSQAMGLCTLIGSLQSFAALQLFSPMQTVLTPAGLYWFYACVGAVGLPYAFLFVRETKGKSVG